MLNNFIRQTTRKFYSVLATGLVALFSISEVKATTAADSVIIPIKVEPGLQFDLVRFKVKPGAKVKIIFSNTDDTDHNFLITKPGTREEVVMEALQLGTKGPAMNYIPESPKVLWAIPVIRPHQESSISFTAPNEPGIFPYVCTYPGHGFLMYGAMYVTTEKVPDITKDLNIPPIRRVAETKSAADNTATLDLHAKHKAPSKPLHPYTPVPPYHYRVFIEGSSPAAIAVNLPYNLSYCWDAGTCRMRFAWKGNFLDNSELWKGKGDALAKVAGEIFFRDRTAYPFRLKDSSKIPEVDFKGYKLVNRYPEFHYTLNGEDVFELVLPKEDGSGIVRNFRFPNSRRSVWFMTDGNTGISYESSAGVWNNGNLLLSASEARCFSITMTTQKQEASL
jgi:azurin